MPQLGFHDGKLARDSLNSRHAECFALSQRSRTDPLRRVQLAEIGESSDPPFDREQPQVPRYFRFRSIRARDLDCPLERRARGDEIAAQAVKESQRHLVHATPTRL